MTELWRPHISWVLANLSFELLISPQKKVHCRQRPCGSLYLGGNYQRKRERIKTLCGHNIEVLWTGRHYVRAQQHRRGGAIRKTGRNTQVYARKLQFSYLGILEPESCISSSLDVKYYSILQSLALLPFVANLPHFEYGFATKEDQWFALTPR